MLKKIILCPALTMLFLGLLPLSGYCQDLLDVKVEQKPYAFNNHVLGKEKPVKAVAYFVKRYNRGRLTETDTVYKQLLARDGSPLSKILFSSNQRSTISDYKYFPAQHAFQWTQKDLKLKDYVYTSKTVRNKFGKDLLYYNASILKGDTTSRQYAKFDYNATGQLIKRDDGFDKRSSMTTVYEYNGKDMVMAKTYNKANTPDFYKAVTYKYNSEHLPVEKYEYLVRRNKADPGLFSYYTYNNKGLLLKERYQGYGDNAKVVETVVDYDYDAKGQLVKLHVQKDALYKEATYTYENGKLKKSVIKTNTTQGLSKEEFFLVNSTVAMPFTYERVFDYDQYGNLVLTTEFVNGEKYIEKISELVYY